MKEDDLRRDFSAGHSIEHIVCSLVAANLCLDRRQVQATSSFRELGADILDFYSIILDLEEVFHLPIPDSESQRFLKVSDVVNWILDYRRPQRLTIPLTQHRRSDRLS